jgi:hypothetical protein
MLLARQHDIPHTAAPRPCRSGVGLTPRSHKVGKPHESFIRTILNMSKSLTTTDSGGDIYLTRRLHVHRRYRYYHR